MIDRSSPGAAARWLAMALLGSASGLPHAALAQSSDSATIDATATLAKAPAVLSLKPAENLRFGTVQIPPTAATQCEYHIAPGGTFTVFEDGKSTGSTACQFLDNTQGAGLVIVNCDPGLTMKYDVVATSQSGDAEVKFASSNELVFADNGVFANKTTCKNDGTVALTLGGQLFVGGNAKAISSETAIGRILLDVAYDDGDGCQYCQ